MRHRFKHLFENAEKSTSVPFVKSDLDLVEMIFGTVKEEKRESQLEFQFDGGSDNFDGNDGDGDDDDGDDDEDDDDAAYLRDKLDVAEDESSIISEARVVFQKDPKTGKTIMICRVDELDVPEEFLNGETMFKADIIFRPFREFGCPKKKIAKIDSTIFKKKNWKDNPS